LVLLEFLQQAQLDSQAQLVWLAQLVLQAQLDSQAEQAQQEQQDLMVVTHQTQRLLVLQEEKDIKAPLEPQEILEHQAHREHLGPREHLAHKEQVGFHRAMAQAEQGVLAV
jgi:hypothetical protein